MAQMAKKVMHWYDYVTVNLFWLGLNVRNTAVGSVFMPYLVAAFVAPDVKNTALSTMRTVGLIVAMLVQPAIGLLSDRSTSRFGRRRPFIFVGVLFDLIGEDAFRRLLVVVYAQPDERTIRIISR